MKELLHSDIGTLTKMKKVTNSTLFCIVHFTKALTVLSSRKCSINVHAKCKTFVYVLMEILPPIKETIGALIYTLAKSHFVVDVFPIMNCQYQCALFRTQKLQIDEIFQQNNFAILIIFCQTQTRGKIKVARNEKKLSGFSFKQKYARF